MQQDNHCWTFAKMRGLSSFFFKFLCINAPKNSLTANMFLGTNIKGKNAPLPYIYNICLKFVQSLSFFCPFLFPRYVLYIISFVSL